MVNKTIVISGASSGLGQEIALLLRNHSLYLLSRHKPCNELKEHTWIPCDISSKEEIVQACKKIPSEIDVFIHCAGVGLLKEFEKTTTEEINQILYTNVFGAVYLMHEIYKRMVVRKSGHMIMVTSTSGKKPRENESVYCMSKFAQAGLSESLFLEAKKHTIKVTTVYPGGMKTNFYQNDPSRNSKSYMNPKDVAKQIVSLLDSEENCVVSQITIERGCG